MAEENNANSLERIFLSALVYNRTGVLLRVASLFARRGHNVISLTVAETENPVYSRITIVSDVEPHKFLQVERQLSKLEDVIKVVKLNESRLVSSELLLIKVHATNSQRTAVLKNNQRLRRKGKGYRPHNNNCRAYGSAVAYRQIHRQNDKARNNRAFTLRSYRA